MPLAARTLLAAARSCDDSQVYDYTDAASKDIYIRADAAHTHQAISQHYKRELCPDHVHHGTVPLLGLPGNLGRQMLVITFTFRGHHSVEGENEWCECPMLY